MTLSQLKSLDPLQRASLKSELLKHDLIDLYGVMVMVDCGVDKARRIMKECGAYGSQGEKAVIEPSKVTAWRMKKVKRGRDQMQTSAANKSFLQQA